VNGSRLLFVSLERVRVSGRYNLAEFLTQEIDINTDLIPVFADEGEARDAGFEPGDIFKTPDGRLGMVGVLPADGRE